MDEQEAPKQDLVVDLDADIEIPKYGYCSLYLTSVKAAPVDGNSIYFVLSQSFHWWDHRTSYACGIFMHHSLQAKQLLKTPVETGVFRASRSRFVPA